MYNKAYYIFYSRLKSWFCFDSLVILKWLYKFYFKSSKKFGLLALSRSFLKNKLGICLFFSEYIFDISSFLNPLLAVNSFVRFSKNFDFFIYINSIFNFLYSNFDVIFFFNNYLNYDCRTFLVSNLYFNKFVSYSFWNYNYNFLINYNFLNKLKIRSQRLRRHGHLIGFKLHCLGRFSRKQRASSIWFKESKVPLNTLSAEIDYSYFNVPLKNSSATVKIWLYKKSNFTKFYFKLL